MPANAYTQALLAARRTGHAMGARAVQSVVASLRESIARLPVGSDNPVTAERAASLRAQLNALIRSLEQQTVSATRAAVHVTARDIVQLHQAVVAKLAAKAGVNVVADFSSVNVRVIAAIGSRARNAATFQTLVNRHMQDAAPAMDRLLTGAIANSVSVRQLTKDVASVLRGEFPSLQDYSLRRTDLSGMRTVLSDARRIALSETNNAMREANAMSLQDSGIVQAVQWQTSGSHGVEDECDELAAADDFGFGAGFYPPAEFPQAPHPACACFAGAVQLKPVSEWRTRGTPAASSE